MALDHEAIYSAYAGTVVSIDHSAGAFDKDGKSDVKSWVNKLREMAKKDQPLIIICRSGRRSGIVSDMLVNEENYSKVYNANSGIMAWINSGLETTKEGLINEN